DWIQPPPGCVGVLRWFSCSSAASTSVVNILIWCCELILPAGPDDQLKMKGIWRIRSWRTLTNATRPPSFGGNRPSRSTSLPHQSEQHGALNHDNANQ